LDLIPPWITRYPNFREQWDPELMTLPGLSYSLAISGDGRTLATSDHDRALKVWDLSTGSEMAKFSYSDAGRVIAISRNGKTVACALMTGEIFLQSLTDEGESILMSDKKHIDSIAFSPNDNVLVALSSDYTLLLWDLETGAHPKYYYRTRRGRLPPPTRLLTMWANRTSRMRVCNHRGYICLGHQNSKSKDSHET
jgi:WD40 repeat protein